MSSTSADRSISSSISLPQWMKTKIGDRYENIRAIRWKQEVGAGAQSPEANHFPGEWEPENNSC